MDVQTQYAIKTHTPLSYEQAVEKVTALLKEEGFGIITEIDMKETLNKKINVDMGRYKTLGACHPAFAYKTITAEPLIGVFLPCNVVVYEENGKTAVAAMNPYMMSGIIDNEDVKEAAEKVTEIFERVIKKMKE